MTEITTRRLAELEAGRGVAVTVDLFEVDGEPVRYEVRGPRYVAKLPVCPCGKPVCTKRCAGYTKHHSDNCHSAGHAESALALARKVLTTYGPSGRRHSPTGPKALTYESAVRGGRRWVQLDGEERTEVRPTKTRSAIGARLPIEWSWWCYSRRCVQHDEQGNLIPAGVVTAEASGTAPAWSTQDPLPSAADCQVAEQEAYRQRNEHVAWHRETFGISGRVQLDEWIRDHAMVTAPEPDRAELDRQLAVARAERKASAR